MDEYVLNLEEAVFLIAQCYYEFRLCHNNGGANNCGAKPLSSVCSSQYGRAIILIRTSDVPPATTTETEFDVESVDSDWLNALDSSVVKPMSDEFTATYKVCLSAPTNCNRRLRLVRPRSCTVGDA